MFIVDAGMALSATGYIAVIDFVSSGVIGVWFLPLLLSSCLIKSTTLKFSLALDGDFRDFPMV